MTRLHRFADHRFIGTRDDMVVHDTEDAEEADALAERISHLMERKLVQTFGPDTLAEARNRGFHPPGG